MSIVTDVNEYRLNLARQMGATRAVNIQRDKLEDIMSELHMLEGFDVGLEMSGNVRAQHQLFKMMNNGGRGRPVGDSSRRVAGRLESDYFQRTATERDLRPGDV